MSQHQGKTVIVTGSGGGLGRVLATSYLESGANVVICDISPDRVQATADELSAAHSGRVHSATVNVTDESSVEALVSSTVSKFGRLDILVNNAGVMDHFDGVATLTKENWDRVMGVNALGPFLCSKAAINQFLAQGENAPGSGGVIINIASSAGIRGNTSGAAYTASKHALLGLTKNMAAFYQDKGISSIALVLGAMPTTQIAQNIMGNMNREGYGKISGSQSSFDPATHALKLEDVGKYCVTLSDSGIAASSNGSCITFNKNWPHA